MNNPDHQIRRAGIFSTIGRGLLLMAILSFVAIATGGTYFAFEKMMAYYIMGAVHVSSPNKDENASPTNTGKASEPSIPLCENAGAHNSSDVLDITPTNQLEEFLHGLKQNAYIFDYNVSGFDAARRLGFSTRFAVTYDEIARNSEVNKSLTRDSLTKYVDELLKKERKLDSEVMAKNQTKAFALYLRSIQSTQCAFPNILQNNVASDEIFDQLKTAYPGIDLNESRNNFRTLYAQTSTTLRNLANKEGGYSIYYVIGVIREVLLSATRQPPK